MKDKFCLLIFVGLFSCNNSSPSKEEIKTNAEIKPSYSVNLNVWLRRDATSAVTWKNIKNNAQVHYAKHNLVPRFRMYKPVITFKDTIYDYQYGSRTLNSYCKNKLVETNFIRPMALTDDYIYAGKNGMLDCVEREEFLFQVLYRKRNDTISNYQIDSLRYEIILDQETVGNDF